MPPPAPDQVILTQGEQRRGKRGQPLCIVFPYANSQLLHLIIDVPHPQSKHFYATQPTPVKELSTQRRDTVYERWERGNIFATHHDRDVDLLAGPPDMETVLQHLCEAALVEEHSWASGCAQRSRRKHPTRVLDG